MSVDKVRFKLGPLYKRWGIIFEQARATEIHPDGNETSANPYVSIEYTDSARKGESAVVEYDYLINATGPKLNFGATEGLGPGNFTHSVCSCDHASDTWEALKVCIERMKNGEKLRILIGTGHPTATCQGAAFEYALNVASEIKVKGLMDQAELIWITNEYEIGDFGMGSAFLKRERIYLQKCLSPAAS